MGVARVTGVQTWAHPFSYTVTDNHGVTASATASVVVTITDAGPVAGSASGSTNEDASTTVTVVGAHAEDSLDSITSWSIGTAGTLGTVTNNNNGTFSYKPTATTHVQTPAKL